MSGGNASTSALLGLASASAAGAALAALWGTRSLQRAAGVEDLDPDSRRVLDCARALQRATGAAAVGTSHVREALEAVDRVRGGGGGGGGGAGGGGADGLTREELEETMKKMLAPPGGLGEGESALERFTRDVTAEARRGRLDPLVGRDPELRRVAHILLRRTKNNPVLVGESGVGKTAIAEGLAQRIVAGDVPPGLMGFSLLELDLPSLAAGCMMPGEFEERLKAVTTLPDKAIDCLDEAAAQVKMEAALAPELLDSLERTAKGLEGEEAQLERRAAGGGGGGRFDSVARPDPVAAACLEGVRDRLEAVRAEAAVLRSAFKEGREAAAAVRAARERVSKARFEASPEYKAARAAGFEPITGGRPAPGRGMSAAEAMALLAPRAAAAAAAAGGSDDGSDGEPGGGANGHANGHANGGGADADADAAAAAADAEWEAARRAELAAALAALEAAEARAASLAASAAAAGAGGRAGRDEVEEGDIARVVSKWTGIPISKLVSSEREKLLHLSTHLHRRIIGQGDAVDAVATAIQRSRADLNDPDGPIASFMFLGPTGVGKTELAKALASFLFNAEDALTRLDMSEYMEKHSVARLIGAPPGYVGYEEGGLLTDAVRRKPYSVVLLDEVEKAHADVFNVLLQILDDGRVTDSQGRLVSFKNAVIIMTSNLGSGDVFAHLPSDSREALQARVMDAVRGHFRPEFINRVDEFIVFEPLTAPQIRAIVGLKAGALAARLAAQRVTLVLGESALDHLAAKGFDPVYGARPVKRALQRELQTRLAQALLRGEFGEGDTVRVEAAEGGLTLVREGGAADANGGGDANGGAAAASEAEPGGKPAAAAAAAAAKPAAAAAAKQRRVVVGKKPAPKEPAE
ncbi:hypothetical protein Rsub_12165 [Raphidocelis subcapitata]|uniref:Uncharacterized protein n=1 Tax=Raphidocelis subcapitata TaxID=307507 RepID=A0A2V0PHR9_9CHLO|nr:hypothetical protein Rsub_12165 [Raphidocelis subcapitata]|eukprot:GBF99361.1 hypothetical protein Rsub_12165 [Raphidocelis subcapitata]